MNDFRLTPKQQEAQEILSGPATHLMLEGGGRSGKTLLHVRNTVMRALMAPFSRHLIVRFRFNHVRASIINETFPAVMRMCFPGVEATIDHQDWFARIGSSEIWFSGLDDRERTEKVLGKEYATVLLNECSQISWGSRELVMTRLAQRVERKVDGVAPSLLKLRAYYDCNPPSKAHWTYRLFHQKLNPENRQPLTDPQEYAYLQMNPRDNLDNISPEYLKMLSGLSVRMRRRFELGEYADATPNALFDEAVIDRWRVMDGNVPQYVRIVVAVDPSGSDDTDNTDNDEIGIIVAALGTDGAAYVLEDCTVKAGPATWGRVSVDAFDRHEADCIVGEINFGGAMVKQTIQTAASDRNGPSRGSRYRIPFKEVSASRGKHVRAEPFSALYEQGRIRHVGMFAELEDELTAISTFGYTGERSPNRADALIWALSELFPGLIVQRRARVGERAMYAVT